MSLASYLLYRPSLPSYSPRRPPENDMLPGSRSPTFRRQALPPSRINTSSGSRRPRDPMQWADGDLVGYVKSHYKPSHTTTLIAFIKEFRIPPLALWYLQTDPEELSRLTNEDLGLQELLLDLASHVRPVVSPSTPRRKPIWELSRELDVPPPPPSPPPEPEPELEPDADDDVARSIVSDWALDEAPEGEMLQTPQQRAREDAEDARPEREQEADADADTSASTVEGLGLDTGVPAESAQDVEEAGPEHAGGEAEEDLIDLGDVDNAATEDEAAEPSPAAEAPTVPGPQAEPSVEEQALENDSSAQTQPSEPAASASQTDQSIEPTTATNAKSEPTQHSEPATEETQQSEPTADAHELEEPTAASPTSDKVPPSEEEVEENQDEPAHDDVLAASGASASAASPEGGEGTQPEQQVELHESPSRPQPSQQQQQSPSQQQQPSTEGQQAPTQEQQPPTEEQQTSSEEQSSRQHDLGAGQQESQAPSEPNCDTEENRQPVDVPEKPHDSVVEPAAAAEMPADASATSEGVSADAEQKNPRTDTEATVQAEEIEEHVVPSTIPAVDEQGPTTTASDPITIPTEEARSHPGEDSGAQPLPAGAEDNGEQRVETNQSAIPLQDDAQESETTGDLAAQSSTEPGPVPTNSGSGSQCRSTESPATTEADRPTSDPNLDPEPSEEQRSLSAGADGENGDERMNLGSTPSREHWPPTPNVLPGTAPSPALESQAIPPTSTTTTPTTTSAVTPEANTTVTHTADEEGTALTTGSGDDQAHHSDSTTQEESTAQVEGSGPHTSPTRLPEDQNPVPSEPLQTSTASGSSPLTSSSQVSEAFPSLGSAKAQTVAWGVNSHTAARGARPRGGMSAWVGRGGSASSLFNRPPATSPVASTSAQPNVWGTASDSAQRRPLLSLAVQEQTDAESAAEQIATAMSESTVNPWRESRSATPKGDGTSTHLESPTGFTSNEVGGSGSNTGMPNSPKSADNFREGSDDELDTSEVQGHTEGDGVWLNVDVKKKPGLRSRQQSSEPSTPSGRSTPRTGRRERNRTESGDTGQDSQDDRGKRGDLFGNSQIESSATPALSKAEFRKLKKARQKNT